MSDEITNLPPQVQERVMRFQQVQQTLNSVLTQKQQVEAELTETDQALNELAKLGDDAVVYKATGSLMIKAEKAKVTAELNDRKELLKTRSSILGKQEERLRTQLKEIQTRLQQDFSPAQPTQAPP